MILQSLVKQYEYLFSNQKVPEMGWSIEKVWCNINLSLDGSIKSIINLTDDNNPILMVVPEPAPRTSNKVPNFLCDNSKYLLGTDGNKICLEYFEISKKYHLDLLSNKNVEAARALTNFFKKWEPKKTINNNELKEISDILSKGKNIVFSYKGKYIHEYKDIVDIWNDIYNNTNKDNYSNGICLVTGKKTDITRLHMPIKGINGSKTSGALLVSFNSDAFCSYGKSQSYNAPIGKYAEFAYRTVLKYYLTEKDKNTIEIGDTTIIFWADSLKKEYNNYFNFFMKPNNDNQKIIKELFEKIKLNKPFDIEGVEINPKQNFYLLGIAPNEARLVVRFFYNNTFGNIINNVKKHYHRTCVTNERGEVKLYGIKELLKETVNSKSSDTKSNPNTSSKYLESIIFDKQYPTSLYSDVILRIKAECGEITNCRASIIKSYLIKNYRWKEGENYMSLNKETKEISYLLGRLFSVLESIQLAANPEISSTIKDVYFNSACATPDRIFRRLLLLENSHIKKIERNSSAIKIHYEKLLSEILDKIDEFPKKLSIEEQGKFILGYYHQRNERYKKKEGNVNE